MKYKVLVTGITGFVGKNLKSYLENRFDVIGISRDEKTLGMSYEIFMSGYSSYDAIIHLAGKAHDLKKLQMIMIILKQTISLLKTCMTNF